MTGDEIARRARAGVGAPFRIHGRDVATGLDCVGLVAYAAALNDVPSDYTMRGRYETRIAKILRANGLRRCRQGTLKNGDILLLNAGPRQQHLAVVDGSSIIHAHASLRRVVCTPLPLPWPLHGHWRRTGD